MLFCGLVLAVNAASGHYRRRLCPSVLDDAAGLAGRALAAAAAATLVCDVLGVRPRGRVLVEAVCFLTLTVLIRATFGYPLTRRWRRRTAGWPTVVVGCGPLGHRVASTLRDHPEHGLTPVCFLEDVGGGGPDGGGPDGGGLPVVGRVADLPEVAAQRGVRAAVVADPLTSEPELVDLARGWHRLACEIYLVPRLPELAGSAEYVWGVPLVRLSRRSRRRLSWRFKRAIDVAVAAVGLVATAPLLAVCALAVRLEGGPGVIFRQERVGLDGRRLEILKLRSLRPASLGESDSCWSIKGDPRLGPVGRLLRGTSLDELPQLWNVLRGDMSLVGPRPERPYFVDQFSQQIPDYRFRHRVPAGLTGWAQVHGLRGDTDIADRARFDNHYIEDWSLWGDLRILLRTAGQVIGRKGLG
jgi:exopolysaccharide biosynthesis polyprenyl glycosylphosphotransferase